MVRVTDDPPGGSDLQQRLATAACHPILPGVSTPPYLDLPPGVSAVTLETDRGPFAVLRAGPAGSPAGLLVPGFTGSKEDFIAVVAPLAAAGFTVVALDLGGQYESPATASGTYSLAGFAADVLAVAGALGPAAVHVVGHSLGGLVAREAVLVDPLAFATLTLMSSGPAALPAGQAGRLTLFATVLAEHGPEVVWSAKRALEEQEGLVGPDDPAIADFLTTRFLASDPRSLLAMVDVLTAAPDRVADLAAVAPPTLVLYGPDDDAWPPETQAAMADRLGARAVVIDGAGHSPAVEQPEATAAALTSFWQTP
jgi:pimeloyl-ACP methyl ester carboxylesterase